jgi:hypothetical protein
MHLFHSGVASLALSGFLSLLSTIVGCDWRSAVQILVGISKLNPHLHAFATAERPKSPLVLGSWEWEALRTSKGQISVIDWNCGDHGSEFEWKVILSAENGVLHAERHKSPCNHLGPLH